MVKAAVLTKFHAPLELFDVRVSDPAPDEVMIRTVASGLCHTDRTMQEGAQQLELPLILGHEAAGVVEAVGSAVTYVRPGDRVVACLSAFCGTCEWCMRGLLQHCSDKRRSRPAGQPPRLTLDGANVDAFVGLGGFAEMMLVHERAVVKLPDEMPLDRAALLGCSIITGMGAVLNTAKVQPGQTVVVLGCGGVGLHAVQAARYAGASQVIAVDRVAGKLDMARELGATHAVDATAGDPVEAVKELSSGGVDHVIEVVGRPATIEQAFAMLRTRGTATVVGLARDGDRMSISPVDMIQQEKRLQGSKVGSGRSRLDIPLYCRLYLDGRIRLDDLQTATISLSELNAAMDDLDSSTAARSIIAFS
jgi:S-(hydroxymethyl)glutathione dehydrogenase/alcohol dehydrogenase